MKNSLRNNFSNKRYKSKTKKYINKQIGGTFYENHCGICLLKFYWLDEYGPKPENTNFKNENKTDDFAVPVKSNYVGELPCGHIFHKECLKMYNLTSCPLCRNNFKMTQIKNVGDNSKVSLKKKKIKSNVNPIIHVSPWRTRQSEFSQAQLGRRQTETNMRAQQTMRAQQEMREQHRIQRLQQREIHELEIGRLERERERERLHSSTGRQSRTRRQSPMSLTITNQQPPIEPIEPVPLIEEQSEQPTDQSSTSRQSRRRQLPQPKPSTSRQTRRRQLPQPKPSASASGQSRKRQLPQTPQ